MTVLDLRECSLRWDSTSPEETETPQKMLRPVELRDLLRQTTEDELSLDAMKKAESIEKLAEKVKNRMKNL